MSEWVCTVCGTPYTGDTLPEKCPVCWAPSSKFTLKGPADDPTVSTGTSTNGEISRITLPGGSTYDLKDTAARSNINGSMTSTKSVKVYVTDLAHTASIPVSAGTTVKITAIVDCESEAIASSLVTGVAGNTTYQTLGLLYNGSTVVAKVSDFGFAQSGRLIVGTYSYTNSSKSAVTLADKSKSYADTLYTLFKSVCSKDHFIVTSLTYAVEVLETATTNKVSKLETLVGALYQKTAEQEALLKGYADRVNALELKNYAAFGPTIIPVLDESLTIEDEKEVAYTLSYEDSGGFDDFSNGVEIGASLDKNGNVYDASDTFAVTGYISSPDERFDYFVRFHSTTNGGSSNSPDRMQKGVNLAVYNKNGTFLWGCPLAMPDWVAFIPRDCKVRVAFGRESKYAPNVDIYTGTKINSSGNTISGRFAHAEGAGSSAHGDYSHAEGEYSLANGDYSHSEGFSTAAYNPGEHAEGVLNKSTRDTTNNIYTKHSIGVGNRGDGTRRNAFEVITNKDLYAPTKIKAYLYGIGNYDGTNVTEKNVKDLASVINANTSAITTMKSSTRTWTITMEDGTTESVKFYTEA